ncbi:unnamed protein product [Trichogramma brassicae]|uniref:Uncharacterized protein n=1 Tax=Trichogramma brassicae TaxID=86971 RepID=A0A6H5J5G5_9HYME|nr:unnamed protein product [Trichogramma brassicae]
MDFCQMLEARDEFSLILLSQNHARSFLDFLTRYYSKRKREEDEKERKRIKRHYPSSGERVNNNSEHSNDGELPRVPATIDRRHRLHHLVQEDQEPNVNHYSLEQPSWQTTYVSSVMILLVSK